MTTRTTDSARAGRIAAHEEALARAITFRDRQEDILRLADAEVVRLTRELRQYRESEPHFIGGDL